ncbi:MAG: hypothetical protein ABI910_12745, partial [Gemmatimonadota bacterium]
MTPPTASAPSASVAPLRPRIAPRWHQPVVRDDARVHALAQALKLPPMVCELLVARGYQEVGAAKQFLRPRLDQLHP